MTTTRQIEIFVKVAELESVRAAAEQLDVSQPTISKHLKALERNVGGQLFERKRGHRVSLSPLGREVLADARRSLSARKRIHQTQRQEGPASRPTIFVRGFMSEWVKSHFAALQEAGLPADTNFVLVDDREDILTRIRSTPWSMSVFRSMEIIDPAGLRSSVLRTETLSLYASVEMAAALAAGKLAPEEVEFLHYARRNVADGWSAKLLEAAGLAQARWVAAPQFIELVIQQVAEGKGLGMFLDWHVRDAVATGQLTRITPDCELAYLMLIGHQSVDQSLLGRMAQVFINHR
ncbi:MAG: LysR family transcriptional regulator [Erythrobacter sp.]|nr:LysR family transcriptional regulator [Erythrobacter sp.]